MTAIDTFIRTGRTLPDLAGAHWLLRIALSAFIAYQGYIKFPLLAADAEGFGVPYTLWILAALGEIGAGMALIVGGFSRTWIGDLATRTGGAVLALIVASVLVVVYWAPLIDLFIGNQFQILLLIGGLYFALRGNSA